MANVRIFSEVAVHSLPVKNRVWMPPMCQYSAVPESDLAPSGPWLPLGGVELQGAPTQWHLQHYAARALGGVGAVIVEAAGVTPEGRISTHCLSLHDDALIPAFAELTEAIHAGGAAAFIQLNHSGRKGSRPQGWLDKGARGEDEGGWGLVAPSALPFSAADRIPAELSEEDILGLVDAYAQAARRAVEAGFDGVQIHGAHGYLIHQFYSPFSNHRSDAWGGDFEGRTRFFREVARAMRAAIGSAPVLMARISATDWLNDPDAPSAKPDERSGWTIADTRRLVPMLVEDGVDMFCMSTGGNVPDAAIPAGPGYQVGAAQAVKETLHEMGREDILVSACGLITSPEQAEQILVLGAADVIEVGRPLLTDPTLPYEWRSRMRLDADMPSQYARGTIR